MKYMVRNHQLRIFIQKKYNDSLLSFEGKYLHRRKGEKNEKDSSKELQKEDIKVEALIESELEEYSDGTYKKIEYAYDEAGNMIKTEIFNGNGESIGWEQYEYNADKQIIKIDTFSLNEDGSSVKQSYEREYKNDRLKSETCILNGSPMYTDTYETYDENGNVLKVIHENLWIN